MDAIQTCDKPGQKKPIQKAKAPRENKKEAEESRLREKWHPITRHRSLICSYGIRQSENGSSEEGQVPDTFKRVSILLGWVPLSTGVAFM